MVRNGAADGYLRANPAVFQSVFDPLEKAWQDVLTSANDAEFFYHSRYTGAEVGLALSVTADRPDRHLFTPLESYSDGSVLALTYIESLSNKSPEEAPATDDDAQRIGGSQIPESVAERWNRFQVFAAAKIVRLSSDDVLETSHYELGNACPAPGQFAVAGAVRDRVSTPRDKTLVAVSGGFQIDDHMAAVLAQRSVRKAHDIGLALPYPQDRQDTLRQDFREAMSEGIDRVKFIAKRQAVRPEDMPPELVHKVVKGLTAFLRSVPL